jgi:hypothetical protein
VNYPCLLSALAAACLPACLPVSISIRYRVPTSNMLAQSTETETPLAVLNFTFHIGSATAAATTTACVHSQIRSQNLHAFAASNESAFAL